MKPTLLLTLGALAAAALSHPAQAGEVTVAAKNPVAPPPLIEDYVGGRGLLTIQGPTGLFI
ncbi:MAG: hypothetical protein ACAH88_17050, partial [Roseimicrobium sp.]